MVESCRLRILRSRKFYLTFCEGVHAVVDEVGACSTSTSIILFDFAWNIWWKLDHEPLQDSQWKRSLWRFRAGYVQWLSRNGHGCL